MIDEENIEKAKNEIKKSKKPVIVVAHSDDYNRKICEYGRFDVLVGLDSNRRKRSLRSIDSGLNHVLAKILTKNKISVGIDLEEIRRLDKKVKAERLSQIIQNIKISKKSNTQIKLLNYKDRLNASSLLKNLGSHTLSASKSLDF